MPDTPASAPDATNSDALLRLIFDHAGEGIAVVDAGLRLRAWNQRFLSLTRIDPTLVHAGVELQALDLAPPDEPGPSVTEHVRSDGRVIEARRNPVPGGGFVMLYADITDRRDEQLKLADQQRMLALLIQRTEQGIWFIDNALRTTDANPAMCRMLGLPLAQMLGRDIYEFVDEANAAIFRERVALRSLGQASSYEITLRHADGHAVHCYNNATPIFDNQGRKIGAVGMFSDITPLKRAEQQVRLGSEMLAQKSHVLEITLDALSQGVLSLDADGRTHAYNRRFLELLQIPDALMQTRPTIMEVGRYQIAQGHFLSPAVQPRVDQWRTDPPLYRRQRVDGVVLEVQTHRGADGRVVRTYTDVTAAVQVQRALEASESRFRRMADAAPALIWQSDAVGAPVWFNQRWLQYTGRSAAQELALGWEARMHADDLGPSRVAFRASAADGRPFEIEYRVLRGDGRLAWIADQGIPQLSSDGSCNGFIVYGWDITARRAAEAGLRAAKDEAERANRAKSEFLSRMSHELRTPLNAVLGFGQLLQADTDEPLSTTQRGRVRELLHGGRHLLSLINDVLDLARIEAGTLHVALARVALAPALSDCLRLVQPAADERGITLVAPADAGLQVLADPTRLRQVLLNLLSNAIKYSDGGGRVELAAWREAGVARIEVRDNGPGLSAEQQARLFQPFERLHAAQSTVEGAGIGLALSKWLLSLMQGQIGVHSSPGAGCVFWVRLQLAGDGPAAPVAAAAELALPPPPAAAAPQQHTVLYIEDNEVNQLLMEGMLAQRPGLRLLVTGQPEDGVALALREQPALVLLDIQLPGIDGYEVLHRLRQDSATRDIPVVAVSANAMPADLEKAARAGFADYVAKPIDLPRLLAVVDALLAR
jgi:PAS domain S-box-containing protein